MTFDEKIFTLLEKHTTTEEAHQFAQILNQLAQQMLRHETNLLVGLQQCTKIIFELNDVLIRKALIQGDASKIKDAIAIFLGNYIESEEVLKNTSGQIFQKFIFNHFEKPEHWITPFIKAEKIYDYLKTIPNKRKKPEILEVFAELKIVDEAFRKYVHDIRDANEVDDQLQDLLEEELSPIKDIIQEQQELVDRYTADLENHLAVKIVDIATNIVAENPQPIVEDDKHEMDISIEDQVDQSRKLYDDYQKKIDIEIDKKLNKEIKQWSANIPPAIFCVIDTEFAKLIVKTSNSTNSVISLMQKIDDSLKHHAAIAQVNASETEIKNISSELYEYLQKLTQHNAKILVTEPIYRMDVEDLRVDDAVEYFRVIFKRLPEELQKDFIDAKISIEKDKFYDTYLAKWQPHINTFNDIKKFLETEKRMERILDYTEQYQTYRENKIQEAAQKALAERQAELLAIEESNAKKENPIDVNKVKSITTSIDKKNDALFNVLITKCNKATLNEVMNRVHVTPENQQYLNKLKERLQSFSLLSSPLLTFQRARSPEKEISEVQHANSMKFK